MRSIRLISLLLCVLLIIPMLFACDKKDATVNREDTTETEPALDDGAIELPDYKCRVTTKLDVKFPGDPDMNESYAGSAYVCFSGENFELTEEEYGMTLSIIFCDNVLYANLYGEKYKIDFNSFDLETVLGLVAGLLAPSADDVNSKPIEMYGASLGQSDPSAPTYGNSESFIFKSVETVEAPDGTETVVYKGLQPNIAGLVDRLLALVFEEYIAPGASIVFDYDSFEIAVSGDDNNASASLKFDFSYIEEGAVFAECSVNISSQCEIGEIDPITAPADADSYEDALPLIMNEIIAGVQ